MITTKYKTTFILLIFLITIFSYTTKAQTYSYCEGDSILLNALDYTAGEVQWQKSTDSINWIDIQGADTLSYIIYPSTSAYYRLLITDSLCLPPYSTIAKYVEIISCPATPGAISGTTSVCQSQSGVAYSVGAITGATGYVWTYTGTGFTIATGTNTNSITADFSDSATSGNLTVYGTNGCGNGTASSNYAITVNTAPSAPTAGTHTPSQTQIVWNWNTVTGAIGYKWNTTNNYSTATDMTINISKTENDLTCNTAYTRYVWAYNDCGHSSSTTLNQTTSACFTCGTSTVDDVDGHTYHTVSIGSQCWLKENMRTTKYPNNSVITKGPIAHGASGWDDISTAYYSCPPNTSSNGEDCSSATTLGLLYQWEAAMNGSASCNGTGSSQPECSTHVQGICPNDWHIPSHYEWTQLERQICSDNGGSDCTTEFLYDESTMEWRGTNSEGSDMAGNVTDQNWTEDDLTGDSHFDNSGLDIGPSGCRDLDGYYTDRSYYTYLWSSTESWASAWLRTLYYTNTQVGRIAYSKANSLSVRCIKD